MTLRCREGDLAIVVKSASGNEGKIVRCLRYVGRADNPLLQRYDDLWLVDRPLTYLWPQTMSHATDENYVPDSVLRPIRGDEQPESISTDRTEPVTA